MEPLIPPDFNAPNQLGFPLHTDRNCDEALNNLSVRCRVERGFGCPERTPAGESHGDQELVSEVLVNRNTRFEPDFCSVDSGRSDFLCRTATFTKAGEDLGHMLGLDCQNYGIPRSDGIWDDFDATFVCPPLKVVANDHQFPFGHVFGEFGNEDAGLPASNGTALEQIQS